MTPEEFNKLSPSEQTNRRIIAWFEEAKDACDGKYGSAPQGNDMSYWRGRREVLGELKAFLKTDE